MKISRIVIQNALSFRDKTEVEFGSFSIFIGPNGGGKTNLLEIIAEILQTHFIPTWIKQPTNKGHPEYSFEPANRPRANLHSHYERKGAPQVFEVTLELTEYDLKNMKRISAELLPLADTLRQQYVNFPIEKLLLGWNLSGINVGHHTTFNLRDFDITPNDGVGGIVRSYLHNFDKFQQVYEGLELEPMYKPFLFLPAVRGQSGFGLHAQLASDEIDVVRSQADIANSRQYTGPSHFVALKLARIYRQLEAKGRDAKEQFEQDPLVKSLRSALASIGMSFQLVTRNAIKNQYQMALTKGDQPFDVEHASSGERELLNYILAIYGLDVRQGIVLIDEPELHLHPRWQAKVMTVFETLHIETGNQFILTTHSPSFVSPSTVKYISRAFMAEGSSRIVRMKDTELPKQKHLFNIVNSQKNERLLFADIVILVEGISDRLVLEGIAEVSGLDSIMSGSVEIVDAGGKGFFKSYAELLKACKVPYVIVADLDYVSEIGGGEIEKLFEPNVEAIHEKVLKSKTSNDAQALVDEMDRAVSSGDVAALQEL